MADEIPQANGNSNLENLLNMIVSFLSGKGSSGPDEAQSGQPQATPMPTPAASPMPTATPTNAQVLQRMNPQQSPTPGPQAGMHPMQQLQMAKASLPQGMPNMGAGKPGQGGIAPDYLGSNDSGNYQQPWPDEDKTGSSFTNPMFKLESEKGALAKRPMPKQKSMGRA